MRPAFNRFFFAGIMTLASSPAFAQLDAIHTELLPASPEVRSALDDLKEVGPYAHLFLDKWNYPVAKNAVAKRISDDFDALSRAQQAEPANGELLLLTALSGRFAYNLELERAYVPTQKLLEQAIARGGDYRANWFLGMLQCQSNNVNGGMAKMLKIEQNTTALPGTFWRDNGICALQANMPQHAARAFGLAEQDHVNDPVDEQLADIAKRGYITSSIAATYEPKQVWSAQRVGDGYVRFTSTLCGMAFTVKDNAGIDAQPVRDGKCVVSISPAGFDARQPHHSPTMLLLVVPAPQSTNLEAYASALTKDKYGDPQHPTNLPCPATPCVSSEFRKNDMYADAGGAHLLSVAFESRETRFPGLVFEQPDGPPSAGDKKEYFRPQARLRRLPGTLYVLALMDASAAIYDQSKAEYLALLRSIRVESDE